MFNNKIFYVLSYISFTNNIKFVSSESYEVQWGPKTNNGFAFSSIKPSTSNINGNGRMLQGGETSCDPVGSKFVCTTSTTLHANIGDNSSSYTDISVYTECDLDSQIKFDFRRASNCKCEAHIHTVLVDGTATPDKYCACTICAQGFGNTPVSIDCSAWANITNTNSTAPSNNSTNVTSTGNVTAEESMEEDTTNSTMPDAIIIDECTSLDCGMNCNGECRLDCDSSGELCEFCSNNPANQPTMVPISNNTVEDDPLANFDGKSINSESTSNSIIVSYQLNTLLYMMSFVVGTTMICIFV